MLAALSGSALLVALSARAATAARRNRRKLPTIRQQPRSCSLPSALQRCYNNGQKIAYGLNEVETLRQSNGLSGTLYNVPMIIGPYEFRVLISTETGNQVARAGNDLGTNHITWGTLNQSDCGSASAASARSSRPAARLATACVRATPTAVRSTASRRSTLRLRPARSTATTMNVVRRAAGLPAEGPSLSRWMVKAILWDSPTLPWRP